MSSSRDLRWRWRRFLIAVLGTGLALALTLLLSGFREGIDLETTTSLRNLGADGFVVREGAPGPFSTSVLIEAGLAERVAELEGVSRADPVVTVRSSIGPGVQDVYLVGAEPGGLGAPRATEGRAVQRSGEAVVDVRAKRKVGERFDLGGKTFDVVGRVRGASVWVGVPNVYITLDDAQAVVFGGREAATTILTRGFPREALAGTHVLTAAQARDDLERPLANAISSIDVLRLMLWVVAAAIMGSVLYISAIERNREFAVCKAFGAAGGDVAAALGMQSLILTTLAAGLAVAMARPLARLFPTVISLPARTVLLLFAVAVIVGLIGSLAGARRALVVDPAAAFSGP
jgi:putative ABC transport system permease protein